MSAVTGTKLTKGKRVTLRNKGGGALMSAPLEGKSLQDEEKGGSVDLFIFRRGGEEAIIKKGGAERHWSRARRFLCKREREEYRKGKGRGGVGGGGKKTAGKTLRETIGVKKKGGEQGSRNREKNSSIGWGGRGGSLGKLSPREGGYHRRGKKGWSSLIMAEKKTGSQVGVAARKREILAREENGGRKEEPR